MKKKKSRETFRESEIPVTLAFMRELRAEMLSGFAEINAQFRLVNARIDQLDAKIDQVNARCDQIEAKIDQVNARCDQIEARIDQLDAKIDQVNARCDQIEAKIDQGVAEMKITNHQTKLLAEEQNLRNKQAYDGYAITYGAIQDLKNRIKPECLEE